MLNSLEYIKYRWNAKGRHGIHSPFVYDFVDSCLRVSVDTADKQELNSLTRELSSDSRILTITDFGAGSRKMGNDRKVAAIFKNSSSHGKYGRLLYQLARHYKPERILEFGTSLGVGTTYLSLGNPNAKITTIEACPETRKRALEHLSSRENIESIESTFDAYLAGFPIEKFDLVFVDGHHDGKALLNYMTRLEAITDENTLFVLDDIRWSESMLNSWNTLIANSDYHLTIDQFRIGIISRRPRQEKEHFQLKL